MRKSIKYKMCIFNLAFCCLWKQYRLVAKDKSNLNHEKYNQGSHDLWYYKAYFYLLDAMIGYSEEYRIFIDIKDTCGGTKVKKLQEVLCNNKYDFKHEVIRDIQQIKSNESEILGHILIHNEKRLPQCDNLGLLLQHGRWDVRQHNTNRVICQDYCITFLQKVNTL